MGLGSNEGDLFLCLVRRFFSLSFFLCFSQSSLFDFNNSYQLAFSSKRHLSYTIHCSSLCNVYNGQNLQFSFFLPSVL